jgi:hypothetical protein
VNASCPFLDICGWDFAGNKKIHIVASSLILIVDFADEN